MKGETDVRNFDTEFTDEAPELTPPDEGMFEIIDMTMLKVFLT